MGSLADLLPFIVVEWVGGMVRTGENVVVPVNPQFVGESFTIDAIAGGELQQRECKNCINFESIYRESFSSKVENGKHLREHYMRIRRVVPYYMLDDLQSVVAAARKDLTEKLTRRKTSDGEGGDEDLFGL